jgi:hypothetical protein
MNKINLKKDYKNWNLSQWMIEVIKIQCFTEIYLLVYLSALASI